MENIVEPDLGFGITLLRPPWKDSVCLSLYEAPIDTSNILIVKEWNMSDEVGVKRASHIFRAYCGSSIDFHVLNDLCSLRYIAIDMIGDHI